MASLDGTAGAGRGLRPEQAALLREWKRLSPAATFVAVMTAPAFLLVLVGQNDWPLGWSLIVTFIAVISFRGLMDILAHRLIPRPSLYGADKETLLDDATARRRVWFWRGKFRFVFWFFGGGLVILWIVATIGGKTIPELIDSVINGVTDPQTLVMIITLGIQL